MNIRQAIVATAALLVTSVAVAGPQCTEAPESEWMDQEALKQSLADRGYRIDKFKVTDGNCYEIYGEDQDGVKVEIYFDPVSGEAVKERSND